ncbi:terminase, partial [Paenibacillus agaridevorans]|uniref:terminase n=1 Tax=Paenibacillus agaridevorans TaxID=171404 RepID=UPI000D5922D2
TQIRKWKSQDKWAADLNSNVTNETNSNVTKRKGAPKGNKNAIGNKGGAPRGNQNAKGNRGGLGGPPGNKKAVTTGEHESIWFDTLDEDEQELLGEIDTDPVAQASETIALLAIRERRMLHRIKKLTEGLSETQRRELQQLRTIKEAIPVHDERTGKMKTVVSTRDELVVAEIEEKTVSTVERILQTEEGLTRVQAQKLKAIKLLYEISSPEQQARVDKLRGEARKLGINEIKEPLRIEIDYGDGDADEEGGQP